MVFRGFFGGDRKKEEDFDPLADLALENMKLGYLVDYDMKTWEVTARHCYDWGEGRASQEWELRGADEVMYLERQGDDDAEWFVSRKVRVADITPDVRPSIAETDDPPQRVTYEGVPYELESDRAGYFHRNTPRLSEAKGQGQQLITWSFIDATGQRFLTLEQWGEREFEAAAGSAAEEFQFSHILPR